MQATEDPQTNARLLIAAKEEIERLKEQVVTLRAERDHWQRLAGENKEEMVQRMTEIMDAACERRSTSSAGTGISSATVPSAQPLVTQDKKRRFDELGEDQKAISNPSISFDQIIPGAQVRYVIINSQPYFSIRDSIMVTSRKDPQQAIDTWSNFKCKAELSEYIERYQFPGPGNRKVDVINLCGLLQMVMMLPGKHARLYRLGFSNILMRYFEGDSKLLPEIESNGLIGAMNSFSRVSGGIIEDVSVSLKHQPAQVCFIYCTFSMAFPTYVKIGHSQNVNKRVSTLNAGCAPLPHTIVAMTPTLNPQRDEDWAHAHFQEYRREGEFFEVSAAVVQEFFDQKIHPRFRLEKEECMVNKRQLV